MSALPGRDAFDGFKRDYVQGLHPKKRAKALITATLYTGIIQALRRPNDTTNGTPQFRFWARERFRLDDEGVVRFQWRGKNKPASTAPASKFRPVIMSDDIYDRIVEAHEAIGHLGRDRTFAQVQERNACIPKELVAKFVEACPTCRAKRNQNNVPSGPRLSTRPATAAASALRYSSSSSSEESDDEFLPGPSRRGKKRKSRSFSPLSLDSRPVKRKREDSVSSEEENWDVAEDEIYPSPPPSSDSRSATFSRSPTPDAPVAPLPPLSKAGTETSYLLSEPSSPPLPFSLPWPKPHSFLRSSSPPTSSTSGSFAFSSYKFSAFTPLDDGPITPSLFLPNQTDRSSPFFRGSETGCEFSFPPSFHNTGEEEEDTHAVNKEASPFKPSSKDGMYATLAPAWSWSY